MSTIERAEQGTVAPASQMKHELDELIADTSDFELPQPELPRLELQRIEDAVKRRVFGETGGAVAAVGRYRIIRKIGGGGVGIVYEALDERLQRRVALKVLRQELATSHQQSTWILDHEAQALAQLAHPNVVTVFDLGQVDDVVYIAMELVDGRTLRQWVEQSRPTQVELLDLFSQISQGLAAAHDAGLVHRDLKPENILVASNGRAKILDFGLGRMQGAGEVTGLPELDPAADIHASTFSVAGQFIGTPAYMSPEQHLGEEIDSRSDQFSLGILVYEMLMGVRPFAGSDVRSVALAIVSGKWQVTKSSKPLAPAVIQVLRTAMHVDANQRFASVREFAEALESAAQSGFFAMPAATSMIAASTASDALAPSSSAGSSGLARARRTYANDASPTPEVWGGARAASTTVELPGSNNAADVREVALRTFSAVENLSPRDWLKKLRSQHEAGISRWQSSVLDVVVHPSPRGVSIVVARDMRPMAQLRAVAGIMVGAFLGLLAGVMAIEAFAIAGAFSALIVFGALILGGRRGYKMASRLNGRVLVNATKHLDDLAHRIAEIAASERGVSETALRRSSEEI